MKKVLVIVDMQMDFISGTLGNTACQEAVPAVRQTIKAGNYDSIFATMDTHDEDYLDTFEGNKLPVKHCIHATEGWKIHPDIENALRQCKDVELIQKPSFGSIELGQKLGTIYEACLADNEKLQIDFVGVCTGICVISNVMIAKAYCPEANIRVLAYACACVTPQSHENALSAMQMCHIEIVKNGGQKDETTTDNQ